MSKDYELMDDMLDEQEGIEEKASPEKKEKRKPYHIWKVGKDEYKLKLTTENIMKVEQKYRTNIMNVLGGDGLPPLGFMLTVIQAAMLPYHHKIKSTTVYKIYDKYVEKGGGQTGLLTDVIIPVMTVSGFFTADQAEIMETKMEGVDDML